MCHKTLLSILLFALTFSGCLTIENGFDKLPPGSWRATLDLEGFSNQPRGDEDDVQNRAFEEVSKGELPFNFELEYEEDGSITIIIKNAEERLLAENVQFGRMKYRSVDTFLIDFPVFDSYIKGTFQERVMKGKWYVNYKENYEVPFKAEYGRDFRFTTLKKKPAIDLSGKWETTFSLDDDPYGAIGEFKQSGNKLTGTFLTETGDFRFLEGTVQGNKFYLSCFDGSHAFLFEGKILEDETLIGSFRSGKHYKTTWTAKRNNEAQLGDPNELTFLKEGYDKIDFSFPTPFGEMVSISDDRYKGKVKLVQIMGTWCPNCYDETQFLTTYLSENPSDQLEVISLAFERYEDSAKAKESIQRFKEKMNVPYEILHAGSSNKKKAAESLPMLNHVLSYPTMIFIDKNDKVRKIHTGFSGPATSLFGDYKKEFEGFVAELIAE